MEAVTEFISLHSKITADGDCSHEIKRNFKNSLEEAMTNLDSILKSRDVYFANKCPDSQSYGFSSGHVWMWELDYTESWTPKNWCFWTVVLEKTLESPLDCKEIQPVHPKGGQSWTVIGRTDAEAEASTLWPPDAKNWLPDPDAGKDWRWEKGLTEDGMAGWHHWLNGHEFEWALGVGDGQGSLVCCSSWGCKELDTTKRVNWKAVTAGKGDEKNSPVNWKMAPLRIRALNLRTAEAIPLPPLTHNAPSTPKPPSTIPGWGDKRKLCWRSLLLSCSVVSDSLWLHRL